jgi:hypothetical protein
MLATEKGRAARAVAELEAEARRLRARLTDAEVAASGARAQAKDARAVDETRLWLLLDTIGQAAVGLKRELALQPASKLPADYVADSAADRPGAPGAGGARALEADDPSRLDQLLALPRAHLIVDGYNVTKKGYGDLALEQQRSRLVTALGGIAAQCGAEVTVVFDGAEKLVARGIAQPESCSAAGETPRAHPQWSGPSARSSSLVILRPEVGRRAPAWRVPAQLDALLRRCPRLTAGARSRRLVGKR